MWTLVKREVVAEGLTPGSWGRRELGTQTPGVLRRGGGPGFLGLSQEGAGSLDTWGPGGGGDWGPNSWFLGKEEAGGPESWVLG